MRTGQRIRTLGVAAVVVLAGLLAVPAADVAVAGSATLAPSGPGSARERLAVAGARYLVGRGLGDVTGEIAEVGMMGYADTSQVDDGLHTRQRARAFVFLDRRTGERVLYVNADIGMIYQSIRDEVLRRLRARHGATYSERNVMLTATHTHAGPGGFSHHPLYNLSTYGYHPRTFGAIVTGIVEAAERAHRDLAPARLRVAETRLENASANRSITAFRRNPARDRRHFPDGVDTRSLTLQVHRADGLDGAVNWFPVHATSMTTQNTLVSADNKGYAAWRWEHEVRGVDYLSRDGRRDPDFVGAFSQTNSGDLSPNLALQPGTGPTDDEFANTRIIGTRMLAAARAGAASEGRELRGAIDSRLVYVDLDGFAVSGRFTPDGRPHRTCSAAFGAAFGAGSTEDGGGGLPVFDEGKDGGNPLFDLLSSVLFSASPALEACQAPKEVLAPVGAIDFVQQRLPVQLVRLGDLYVVGLPVEVTVVAGLRVRRAVARALGVDLGQVLVQGYSNAFSHYLTTPQEYDAQEYEGASTLFGRYELPAFTQVAHGLAVAMRSGATVPRGVKERDRSSEVLRSPAPSLVVDTPPPGRSFGDPLAPPRGAYRPGATVQVGFVGAHPRNDLQRGSTYLVVERRAEDRVGQRWVRVADDGDWATRLRWRRTGGSTSRVDVRWDVPVDVDAGRYRIRYLGTARTAAGALDPFVGVSRVFRVG